MESSRPWPWPRGASRTIITGHVLGLGLGKHILGLKYFSVLWLKLTVNFITNFENLAIKMKLVITSPAIKVCVMKFWLNSESYWHWPWHRPALALDAKFLALALALKAKSLALALALKAKSLALALRVVALTPSLDLMSFQVSVASPATASGNRHFTPAPGGCHSDIPAIPGVITGNNVSGFGSEAVNTEYCSVAWRGWEATEKDQSQEETYCRRKCS